MLPSSINLLPLPINRVIKKFISDTYFEAKLERELSLVRQYDVVILCNVLHELFMNADLSKRKTEIFEVYKRITKLLVKGGTLIMLEGIKPDNADSEIEVELVSEEWVDKFEKLVREYKAAKLWMERMTGTKVKTNVFSLSVFLTKARYLNEKYWESESEQLYQFFSVKDFEDINNTSGMKVRKVELQALEKSKEGMIIKTIPDDSGLPAKNVLVIAEKCD